MKIVISFVIISFIGGFFPNAFAQEFTEDFVVPVVIVYPSVWKESGVVPPTIEVIVQDQVREESILDKVGGDEKLAMDLEAQVEYFEISKDEAKAGDIVEVCISAIDSEKYPNLSKCSKRTIGGDFPEIAVFVVE